ncbi:FadR/GntR family transcriptional regulator [Helcococcus bovis]|uniref:FadR/GntR family transcriptional regulator n=1 Tax=Helcococcus bovis TaxID=3153252 RepID=UPI0038B8B003
MLIKENKDQLKNNLINKKNNLKNLRLFLNMTQKEFIKDFLSNDDGYPEISVSTLSNIENKGGVILDDIISKVSSILGINNLIFTYDKMDFLGIIENQYNINVEDFSLAKNKKNKSVTNLVNRLTLYFAEEMLKGNLKKGDKIESDRKLAKKMDVGRSALREALKVLEIMGMINIRHGQGSYISDQESNFFDVPLTWSLFMNYKQIYDVLQVRSILEEKAAELAAFSVDKEKLNNLKLIIDEINKSYREKDFRKFLDLDMKFHIAIAECSGNTVIISQILSIQNLLKSMSKSGMQDISEIEAIYNEHLAIYNAIVSRKNDDARRAMAYHMGKSFDRYKSDYI